MFDYLIIIGIKLCCPPWWLIAIFNWLLVSYCLHTLVWTSRQYHSWFGSWKSCIHVHIRSAEVVLSLTVIQTLRYNFLIKHGWKLIWEAIISCKCVGCVHENMSHQMPLIFCILGVWVKQCLCFPYILYHLHQDNNIITFISLYFAFFVVWNMSP